MCYPVVVVIFLFKIPFVLPSVWTTPPVHTDWGGRLKSQAASGFVEARYRSQTG